MVLGVIFLGMLCAAIYSGISISRTITKYEKAHDGEDWGNE